MIVENRVANGIIYGCHINYTVSWFCLLSGMEYLKKDYPSQDGGLRKTQNLIPLVVRIKIY
jgi:hypothetical protein